MLCKTDGLLQPCGADGGCLTGYACKGSLCQIADGGGAPAVCGSDVDCPAGACVATHCEDGLVAWNAAGTNPAVNLGCFGSFPPPPVDAGGGAPFQLTGCIATLPGDTLSGRPSLFSGPTQAGVAVGKSCSSGYSYEFFPNSGVPVGALFELDVYTDAGPAPTRTYPVFLDSASPTASRNAFAMSPARASSLLAAFDAGLGPDAGLLGTLILGVVNDCDLPVVDVSAGTQLSGVHVQVQTPGHPVLYLDATGEPQVGRSATSSSGWFAAYVASEAGQIVSLTYFAASDGGLAGLGVDGGVVAIDVSAGGGVVWVPLAPNGP